MYKRLSLILLAVFLIFSLAGCKDRNTNPVLVLEIESEYYDLKGTIEIEMYYDKAPNTVKNIIYLASEGFYDGITIAKVLKGHLIEIGDPRNIQLGGIRYAIDGEFKANGFEGNDIKFERGVVAMSRYAQSYDSAVGDFFILLDESNEFDDKYAAFGKIIKGLDFLDEIGQVKTVGAALGYEPIANIKIVSTYLKLKGLQYDEPKRHVREYYGVDKD